MTKRELLNKFISGEISREHFRREAAKMVNGILIGIMSGHNVAFTDPATGEEKTATKPEFETIGKSYFAVLAQIVGSCDPITNENDIPDDLPAG